MVAAPPQPKKETEENQAETPKTGELSSMAGKKLLVMTVLERIKALQPIAERELIANLSVGEPYLSVHKAEELIVNLFVAKKIKYDEGGLLCLM